MTVPQFGQPESLAYDEFVKRTETKVNAIFDILKETGPTVPTVTGDDPAAVGAATVDLVIDTEQKKPTPALDAELMKRIQDKWMDVKKDAQTIMENQNFPNSDKDRIWEYMWSLRHQFADRGISID